MLSVCCTATGEAAKVLPMAGSEGKYVSMPIGPTMDNRASTMIKRVSCMKGKNQSKRMLQK